MKTTLTSLLMLAAASPALLADINAAATPSTPTPQTPTRVMGNCDLLASNTVLASFVGVRALQTQTFDQAAPTTVQVAVFQVVNNLAYKRFVRYGDGSLKPGTCFTVSLVRDLPGQPANIADTIAQMQPGEQAVMKIDHLYIFGDQEGKPIRPCSRMALRQGGVTPAPNPAMVPSQTPPVQPAPAATQPAPVQQGSDASGDDTTVEQAPQNAAAAPIPAPAPTPGSATVSGSESF